MAVPLPPGVAEQMRDIARAIKDRQASGTFTRGWTLTGKNAIVEPGRSVVVRLGPRWDYANSMIVQGDKRVQNPEYKGGALFVMAWEHWWDDNQSKTQRIYCPKTLDVNAICPICIAAAAMMESGVKEDQTYGKRIKARDVYIFNAAVGNPRKVDTQTGRADIRIIPVSGTVFIRIRDIMTGGDNEQFMRGDISHPREGYDLKLTRPNQGERWTVDCDPNPSPLYGPDQAAAFKGWPSMLIDLEEMLEKETKTPVDAYRAYYGKDPTQEEMAEMASASAAMAFVPANEEAEASVPAPQQRTASPAPPGDDDDFMPPTSGTPSPQRAAPTPPPASGPARPSVPPRPQGRPTGGRGRR